jgi:Tol biopolymer transport system component
MKTSIYQLILFCSIVNLLSSCKKEPEVLTGWQDELGGKIAITTPNSIYLIDSESITKIRQGPPNKIGPVCFSPDGEKIVFTQNDTMFTMDINGTNCMAIASDTNGIGPYSWSPDGSKIAFVRNLEGISIMNPDGTGIEFLTEGSNPWWTADGENIVYADHINSTDIYTIRLSDKLVQKIAVLSIDQDYNWLSFAALSPDNKELLFDFGSTWSYNSHIGVMTIEGNQSRQITQGYNVFNYSPCWSADSKKILYFCDPFDDDDLWGHPDLCLMDADGSDKKILKWPDPLIVSEKVEMIWYNGSFPL